MAKKLSLLLAATVVLAFAVPAFANAATGLTEGGKLVPVKSIITGTNTSQVTVTSAKTGNVTCAVGAVMVEWELTSNSATTVQGGLGGKRYTATCKTATNGIATVTNLALSSLDTSGGNKGTYNVSFEIDFGPLTCTYKGTGDTFTYNETETGEGGEILTSTSQPLSVGPLACGSVAELDGSFGMATQSTTTSVFLM